MKRGPWHQFGDRSQRLALEQLEHGSGVGVIISPRDLSFGNAADYAPQYRALGADVLIDQQFYVPDSTVGKLSSYPISEYRDSISKLHKISDKHVAALASELHTVNAQLETVAVIAPAVIYQAGRPDIVDLNARLFEAAKSVGNELGVPTYATVVVGRSVTTSDVITAATLSDATSLNADGWYFGFEFDEARIPTIHTLVLRCCVAGLTLACTGKPVLHAYAGPMGLLSLGFGTTGVGVGHSQNLWQFTVERWYPSEGQGGGGDAPPRFFSRALWGTIIYEDEFALLSPKLRERVFTPSPFSQSVSPMPPYLPWSRWDANKHLVNAICSTVSDLALEPDPRNNVVSAMGLLAGAVSLHLDIENEGITLADATNAYQLPWKAALESLLAGHAAKFDFLTLL